MYDAFRLCGVVISPVGEGKKLVVGGCELHLSALFVVVHTVNDMSFGLDGHTMGVCSAGGCDVKRIYRLGGIDGLKGCVLAYGEGVRIVCRYLLPVLVGPMVEVEAEILACAYRNLGAFIVFFCRWRNGNVAAPLGVSAVVSV